MALFSLSKFLSKFLRYASFILAIPPHEYTSVSNDLDLVSLADRRRMLGLHGLPSITEYNHVLL